MKSVSATLFKLGACTSIALTSLPPLDAAEIPSAVNNPLIKDRMPLVLNVGQIGIEITATNGNITLSPKTPDVRPLAYLSSTNASGPFVKMPQRPDLMGSVTTNIGGTDLARFFIREDPNLSATNGNTFLRIPTSMDLRKPQSVLCVVHGDTGRVNAGYFYEQGFNGVFEYDGTASTFPTAPTRTPPQAIWRGQNWYDADYQYLAAVRAACMNVVHPESDYVICGYSRGAEAALGYALLYPDKVDRLVIYAGFHNANVVKYVNSQRGPGYLADNPVPTVVISSPNDSLHPDTIKIAQSMAEAHGYKEAPVRRPGSIDLNETPSGKDSYILEYGPFVIHIVSSAPSHEATFVLSAEPGAGADIVNLGFIKNGKLP